MILICLDRESLFDFTKQISLHQEQQKIFSELFVVKESKMFYIGFKLIYLLFGIYILLSISAYQIFFKKFNENKQIYTKNELLKIVLHFIINAFLVFLLIKLFFITLTIGDNFEILSEIRDFAVKNTLHPIKEGANIEIFNKNYLLLIPVLLIAYFRSAMFFENLIVREKSIRNTDGQLEENLFFNRETVDQMTGSSFIILIISLICLRMFSGFEFLTEYLELSRQFFKNSPNEAIKKNEEDPFVKEKDLVEDKIENVNLEEIQQGKIGNVNKNVEEEDVNKNVEEKIEDFNHVGEIQQEKINEQVEEKHEGQNQQQDQENLSLNLENNLVEQLNLKNQEEIQTEQINQETSDNNESNKAQTDDEQTQNITNEMNDTSKEIVV